MNTILPNVVVDLRYFKNKKKPKNVEHALHLSAENNLHVANLDIYYDQDVTPKQDTQTNRHTHTQTHTQAQQKPAHTRGN